MGTSAQESGDAKELINKNKIRAFPFFWGMANTTYELVRTLGLRSMAKTSAQQLTMETPLAVVQRVN